MVEKTLSPERLLEAVRGEAESNPGVLSVLWYRVTTGREKFREGVERHRQVTRVVPLVIRDQSFDSPNAALADLCRLIERHRESFESAWFSSFPAGSPIVLLLIAASELRIPQVSSPVTLPSWFPEIGGMSAEVVIKDLTHAVTGLLNGPELHLDDLCGRLYELERAIVERLAAVSRVDHNAGNGLFTLLGDQKRTERFGDMIAEAEKYLKGVLNPQAFRPSAREGRSVIGRIMRLVTSKSPDQLGQAAKAFVSALAVEETTVPIIEDSFVCVLCRPTSADSPVMRFGRNIVTTIYAAAQLTTAAAHADAYPKYPLGLMRYMSQDLRSTLAKLAAGIRGLP